MSTRALKWPVPVDDAEHLIGAGRVLHVDHQGGYDIVMVWTLESDDAQGVSPGPSRPARVFGTGQPLPDGWKHLGSTVTAAGTLVWHVFADNSERAS